MRLKEGKFYKFSLIENKNKRTFLFAKQCSSLRGGTHFLSDFDYIIDLSEDNNSINFLFLSYVEGDERNSNSILKFFNGSDFFYSRNDFVSLSKDYMEISEL